MRSNKCERFKAMKSASITGVILGVALPLLVPFVFRVGPTRIISNIDSAGEVVESSVSSSYGALIEYYGVADVLWTWFQSFVVIWCVVFFVCLIFRRERKKNK